MRNVFSAILLSGSLLVATVQAAPESSESGSPTIVISTGAEGGGYWGAAERLRDVAAQKDLSIEVVSSTGSRENLQKLLDPASPVSMAFAQADAIQHYVKAYPDAGKYAEVLENLGEECVFALSGTQSGLDDLGDLVDDADEVTLTIDSNTSGAAATFDFMADLIPDLEKTTVRYAATGEAVESMLADPGSASVVLVVHRPRAHSPAVDLAIANPDKIQFMEIPDKPLKATLGNGDSVYRPLRLMLPGAEQPIKTVCVKGYLLVSKSKLQVEQLKALTDLVTFQWMRVYATP